MGAASRCSACVHVPPGRSECSPRRSTSSSAVTRSIAASRTDINEATRIEWIDIGEVQTMLAVGEISDGLSFGALAFALASRALTTDQ